MNETQSDSQVIAVGLTSQVLCIPDFSFLVDGCERQMKHYWKVTWSVDYEQRLSGLNGGGKQAKKTHYSNVGKPLIQIMSDVNEKNVF